MQKITDVKSGIYVLEIQLSKKLCLKIRKFRNISFGEGFYYYLGSAQKNLPQRIARHIRKNKKLHWHIDHLTYTDSAEVKNIIVFPAAEKSFEDRLALEFLEDKTFKPAVKGFGNSDSKNSFTHLFRSVNDSAYNHLLSKYQRAVSFIPSSIGID